jgi:hypothetical protein
VSKFFACPVYRYTIFDATPTGDEGALLFTGSYRQCRMFLDSVKISHELAHHAMRCAQVGPYFILSGTDTDGSAWFAHLYADATF